MVQVEILDFAKDNNLELVVGQRSLGYELKGQRFHIQFNDSCIKEGNSKIGVHGNGNTFNEALRDYANQISWRLLLIEIPKNIEFRLPWLVHTKDFIPEKVNT